MPFKQPPEIAQAGIDAGAKKAHTGAGKLVVAGFLGGAYIAFGALLAITVSAGMDPEVWGGMITFVSGLAFSLGLILVVIAGSELLTGNMALVPLAALQDRASWGEFGRNLGLVLLGNLAGALFVAYVLAVQTGVVTAEAPLERLGEIATAKAVTETDLQVFLRAIGCNWLVCLGVWMALGAQDIAGKVLAIIFPITAFVAVGFDHVVANMFFLPAAIFAGVDGIGWGDVLGNWGLAFAGNMVGAGIFVAGFYWYLYVRPDDDPEPEARAAADGHGPVEAGAGGNGAAERPVVDRTGRRRP